MNICVVGLGETGASIIALAIQELENSQIHVLDPSDSIAGRLLDLQHAGAFRHNRLTLNDHKGAELADIIFYCAGIRNPKEGDRFSVAKQNKNLIHTIFSSFSPNKTAKIIVVTNPVELITEWISEYFEGSLTVVGTGTELDTFRLKFILAERLNCLMRDIDTQVVGEHGNTMVPLYSQTTVGGESIHDLLSQQELNSITEELRNSAKTIRVTEEATKFGVAQCALEVMNSFLQINQRQHILSTLIHDDFAHLPELSTTLFISQPCFISKEGVIPKKIVMSEQERALFIHSAKQLMKVDSENK